MLNKTYVGDVDEMLIKKRIGDNDDDNLRDTDCGDELPITAYSQEIIVNARRRRLSSSYYWPMILRNLLAGLLTMESLVTCATAKEASTRMDCELYIAESTIPNAGLGIFTGVAKAKGDTIGNGDKAIPLVDLNWHAGDYSDHEGLENETVPFFNPTQDYVWHGLGMGMDYETVQDDITAFWPGVDAMINCNLGLLNVIKSTPIYDEGGLHRNMHPGAGGITPYNGVPTHVIRDIPAGGEIFKHYGDEWFSSRSHFGGIPLSTDYEDIVDLLTRFNDMIGRLPVPKHVSASILYDELLVPTKNIWNSRTLNALFNYSWSDVEPAVRAKDFGVLLQPAATRSLDWLDEHGKCIDHIVQGPSTIEGAGHGAFAKRDLPKGTIITGTPLVHFPNRDVLGMFDPKDSPVGPLIRDVEKGPYSYQILINYCFGHPESTILLCPYGAGVNYINANRTKANVKVQWAQDGNTNHNSSWLDTKPEDMEWVHKTMLAMDYVALRDIKKGEELFLDYGNSWEQAWEAHVKAWEAVTEREEYISSTQYNAIHSSAPVRTLEELRDNPYPQNLQINCHPALIKSLFHEMDYENRYKDPLDFIEQVGWLPENKGFECDILEHDTTTDTYKVTLEWTEDGQTHEKVRDNVPRKAIMFVDSPYTTDIHLPSAFRHPIDIPDEMLPEAWRNMECKMGQRCA